MRQPINLVVGCAIFSALSLSACASSSRLTHGQIPRDDRGVPIWSAIEPSPPLLKQPPIFVPAGPPIRNVQGAIVQPTGS